LGLKEKKADTFAQQMVNVLKYPIDNFRRIQNLGKFGVEEEGVHWALKDVSFEVKQGEVLGIIGKNGAGKSTLLKILSKITEPTSGRIEVNGRIAALLEVGTGFHPELSGRENIYMNGTILGMTRREIDKKLDEIIDFSGVEKFIDTPIKFYSSGMKVRLGFSVAAHLEPEILVIDEVLSVGDFEFQQKCLGKMEDVAKNQGRTVLFVSHNLGAVNNLTNKSILMSNGRLVMEDKTELVINKYINFQTSNVEFKFHSESIFNKVSVAYSDVKSSFYSKESLDFMVDLNAKAKVLKKFRFGFTISSIDDINIISGISNSLEVNPDDLLRFKLSINNLFLVEGEYKLSFSIGMGNVFESRKEYEVARNVITFSVANMNQEQPSLMNWQSSYGNLVHETNHVNLIQMQSEKIY
jgi:lipopolysaccharide transport system ATP-binding protein